MSQQAIYLLLAGALVLPVLGAIVLRALSRRIGTSGIYAGALLIFFTAAGCVLVLTQQSTGELRIGQLTLIQPLSIDLHLNDRREEPFVGEVPATGEQAPLRVPTQPAPAETSTSTPTATPPPRPTATLEPTATELPEPTLGESSPEGEEPPEPRVYIVQAGDTIGAIAEQEGGDG
ncbi:MAG: hypothetical protein KatS3mg057_1526 [Herpetosiphonaceae bacterium]|nr:MAG: hypothetical protein KatS3mg057_1526 [Herpetosiphonaceae bacterium]